MHPDHYNVRSFRNEILVVDYSKVVKSGFRTLNIGCCDSFFGREFHGFTTHTAKLNFLTSNRDCCACSFNEWSLVFLLSVNYVHFENFYHIVESADLVSWDVAYAHALFNVHIAGECELAGHPVPSVIKQNCFLEQVLTAGCHWYRQSVLHRFHWTSVTSILNITANSVAKWCFVLSVWHYTVSKKTAPLLFLQ